MTTTETVVDLIALKLVKPDGEVTAAEITNRVRDEMKPRTRTTVSP